VAVAVVAILAVSVSACGPRVTPKVSNAKLITSPAEIPDYAKGITWPRGAIALDVNVDVPGPHNDPNSNGTIQNVHWVAFEGVALNRVKVERYVYMTQTANNALPEISGQGYQGPKAKVPSDLSKGDDAYDGPSQPQQIQYFNKGAALVMEDAPGAYGIRSQHYPFEWHANYLVQVKYGGKVLAEMWYDVDILARSAGPNGVQINKATLTDWRAY